MKITEQGFTLIELLVVVLIIGILAAIALPKYQLAVDKTEFAKMQMMVSTVRKAYLHHFLIHGEGPKSFKELDLNFPPDVEEYKPKSFFKCMTLPDMYLCMSWGGNSYKGNVRAFKKDLSVVYSEVLLASKTLKEMFVRTCGALEDNARANRLCSQVGSNKHLSSDTTPSGDSRTFYAYDIN